MKSKEFQREIQSEIKEKSKGNPKEVQRKFKGKSEEIKENKIKYE